MTWERVIRPFQTGEVFDARKLAPVQPAPLEAPEDASITWRGRADSTYVEAPPLTGLQLNLKWVEDRKRRVTEEHRIENPDDPSQYVVVERIRRAFFKNLGTGEELNLDIDWD